ncbi:1185_t:CDS:2, partial [Scutellospora calospora]
MDIFNYSEKLPYEESSDFVYDLHLANLYIIGPGEIVTFKYSKHIRKVLTNALGNLFAQPQYDQIPYINSDVVSLPYNRTVLTIVCLSTVVVTEEERLVLTFSDVFGFVGGFFTLATLIFVQLFGESTRRPWGIVQSLYCC